MKNKLHRFFTLFVVIGLCISQLFAVPAFRGWQERTLTDGTPIRVRLVGDEFYHLWETEDGKIATMQEDGTFIISSEKAPSMKQVSERCQSARAAKIPASRIQKNYSDIQPTKLLVILVNFSDKSMKSTHNNAFFDNLLNGPFPSVQDYFKQSSGNTYVPQFDVFGPYTLDQNMAYYGSNDSDGSDEHPDQMVVDACAKAYADGCNFSNYDTNNDGKVDNIYVIYAGYGEAAGAPANTIWPHSWEIYSGNVTGTLKYNNKTLVHYACSAELSGKSGSNSDGVGTFAHEFSHVIGLPDYYDTDYGTNSDNGVTPGEWTLMDQGSYNGSGMYPPLYSVYDKYFMGWMTPKFLAKDKVKNVTLTTTWNDNYQITGGASRVACTNTSTVYYLENRQKSGYDQYLPGHGMVVWKVTYNATRWNNNDLNNTAGTLRYTIVPADGKTKNYGQATDPFPGTSGKKTWTPFTGCALSDITESSGTINFKYNGGVVKTTWDYVIYGENCTHPADGEVTKDGTLNLTITPSSGYTLADPACWEVQMGGTTLTYGSGFTYNSGTNKFTITSVTGDVEITVRGGRTINWNTQGSLYRTNVSVGGTITLPDAPANCSASRQFVGWCTNSTYKSADTPPTYAKTGDAYSVANYYAVYADVSGGGSADATYTFTSKSWEATEGNWTSGKDGTAYLNGGVQVTTSSTGAYATCPNSYNNVSSIVVSYCTNSSKGAGSIKLSVNGTEVSESVTSSGGTTPRDLEFDFSENTPTGTPKITVNCSSNSIYICGVTITYGSASYSGFSTDCTAPDPCALTSITLNTTGVKTAFTTGEAFTSEGLVVTANYSNCSSKTVTPTSISTPDMSSTGNKTVTVTYTENTVTKSTTYNITVSAPTTYSIRFFDGATQLKAESLIMGATATPPTVDDCDEYEFIGWYTSTLVTNNTTSYTWISDFTVSGTQNYYAVFSHTEGSGGGGTSEVASVTFVTVNSDSNTDNSGTDAKIKNNLVDEYSGISSFSGSKLYAGTAGVKLGSSSAPGSITLTLPAAANIKTVKVSAKKYGSDTGSLSVTAGSTSVGSAQAPPSSIGELTFTATSAIEEATTITVATSSKRAYISSIVVIAEGGGTTYYTTTKDCTIPTEVTVKFDANGGEGIMTDQTIDYNTATALKANSFERTGYTFLGWATTADGAKVYDDEEEVTLTQKTTTLYAVWEKNSWNVYFTTPSGATVVTANGATESPLTVEYGETVTIVISPDAEHTISAVTATGDAVLSGEGNTRTFTMPDADVAISITMVEKPTYAVNFINMGETISSQSVIEGQTAVKPSDPSACEGYTFVGWWTATLATDNTTAETWVTDFTVTDVQDYYAVYSHTEGGGGGSESPVTKTMNTFDAISGNVDDDANISYEAAKGEASTAPAVNSSQIRIYQNGGTLTIIAKNGKKITNVTIGSAMETSVTYSIDGGTTSSSQNISAGGNIALSDLNANTILFTCTGTDKNHRLYLNYLSVTYIGGGSGGGSTTYYTTSPSCTPCENKVALTKGVESHGTFTLNKADGEYNNCDADFVVAVSNVEAAEGYRFVNVTATGGNNVVGGPDGSGNYTVTYTKGNNITSTVTANFEVIPSHNVTWNVNGDDSNTDSYQEGKAIVFPETASGCEGKVFVGWSATEVAETDVAPAFTSSALMGDHDVTYYAVFATASGSGGGAWDGSTAGTYKIYALVDDTKYYATGTGSKIDGSTDINDAADYTFEKVTDGWAIKTGDTYITYSSSTNLGTSGSAYTWELSSGVKGTWRITAGANSARGWIYRAGTSNQFGGYATSNVTASGTEYYDLEIGGGGGTSYSGYTTSCTPCENKVTLTKGSSSNGTFALDKADGEYENCAVGGLVVHVTDITSSEDYQFKEITQTGIATGVTIDQAGKTVTYSKDVAGTSTINVIFEPKPSYTIRFYNNESLIGPEQTVVSGKTPIVPSNPEACEGYTFVGWWTSSLPANNTESHAWVSDFTATGNQDYYAVYRHNEGGSGSGTESVTFSDIYTSNTVVEDISIAIGTHTSVTFTKGGSDTQYYTNGDAIRWYGGGTCVVASDAGNITGIIFTFGSSDGNNMIEAEGYDEPTWTGEAASVTFTQSGTSGNRRIAGISVTVDGGGTAHYTSVFSCSGHTITVESVEHGSGASDKSRCDEGGTVTITLTADEGYDCDGITTSPVVSVTKKAECTYTFTMPASDITVTPVFTPKTPRTFTFEKGTGICATSTLTETIWHGGVTLPTATANSGCDPEYVFAGWATSAVTIETEVRPTLYAAGTLYNGEETTLYAVYSQTTGGSASGFTLSYTIDDVTYYAAARTGTNKYMGATTDVADAARFTIVTSNDKQYLCWHGENDTYVSNNSNKTDLLFTTNIENAYSWDITETGNTIALAASSGRHFMFNTNIAQRDRFAAYSTDDVLVKGDAGTTVYNTSPSCVCYSVDITYNANGGTLAEGCENVTEGECERDWLLCDAPTRDGYLFTNWKDQNGTLYDAGAVVTDLKISLTLTAQWIPAPYTVLFDAGTGSCVESLTEASRGDGIILPKAEPSAACAEDWTFVGWSATELVGETNTTATIIGVAGVPYVPTTNNVTLYAVYSSLDEGGATPDYTRVTVATPEEGDYAIVVAKSDESFGLLTYGTIAKGRLVYTKAYTSLPSTTISSPEATQIWHLTYDASGYAYLYNANAGAYLAASGSNIDYNASAGSAFVLTKDPGSYGDYECLNSTASGSTNYYLGANKDADYIRYYGSTTLIALNSVTLYKGSTGTRYYSTAPACTPCTDPEWSFEMGTSITKTKGSEPFTNTVNKVYESTGTVTYSSTNEAVATVDASGLVTMHETGTTTITLRLTKAMPYCAAVLQYELEVKEPSIDIVGVTPDGEIILEHDLEGTITLDLSEGNAISTGTAANDLFFSKYFEAASNMKLFAIFNGTGHEMDLSNIRVRCNCTTSGTSVWPSKTGDLGYVELRTISKLREQYPKLKIPSGTELIFWSNNKGDPTVPATVTRNSELRECITFTIGDMNYHYSDMEAMEIPNWFCLGGYTGYNEKDADGNNQFVFNGDDSMILERYNPATGQWEAIDLFGAGTSSAPASTEGLVENISTTYEINGISQRLNDGNGFHAECEGNPIPLSTNRYMLVRKNTVLDGMTAVASNTTSFATLCDEWDGTPVGGTADAYCKSGNVFSEIAEYDYAENYIAWDEITDDKYDVDENEDGTVSVTFTGLQDLAERACSLLKIEVHDKDDDTKILATTEYKIPIVVKEGDVMTTAELFHNQAEKCATCDVAILGSAILTKATDGATNDMPEVRDIYVYGGGKLVIPSGTHYRARDLIMRMQMADDKVNVEVPNVRVDGSLTNQYGGSIRQQVRVGTSRFYQFAVPYPVRLEDVTFSDGTPAVYGEDFMIRYYDGEQRAANQGTASNWRNFEGTQLMPGVGYTLAVAKKAGHEQRELVFPMLDASLNDGEPASKETTIHAWGDNSIRANHRGWNFLSNPYLTTYAENNLNEDAGGMLTTGQLVPDPEHPGWWVNSGDNIPYVTLINPARTDYRQELVSLKELPPFTTFFIQAGDDDHSNGEEFSLTFDRAHRAALSAPAYIRAAQKTPVARFGVLLSGNGAEDNCGVVVGEKYSAAYDMQADLSKEFGSAYSLKLYSLQEDKMQMAFLATHPDSLSQPIPLGVRLPANGEYTFSIDRRYNLGAFAHIYLTDNLTGQHTDLLDDTYTFTGSRQQNDARFSLSVEMQKETPTDIQHLLNGVYAVGRDGSLLLTGMPETADIYIYDMGGRMVHSGHTQGATSVTYPLPTGVYQIRVLSEGANALLRTIVY